MDAGMTSKENTDHLLTQGLDHITALPGPQQVMFQQAQTLAEGARLPAGLAEESSTVNASFACSIDSRWRGWDRWGHLREIWRVKQTTIVQKSGEKTLRASLPRA